MKRIFLFTVLLISNYTFAQKRSVPGIPVLSNPNLSEVGKELLDANQLYRGQIVRFSFNVLNPNQSEVIKAGSCQLEIQLSDKLKQVEKSVANMYLNSYFAWSVSTDASGKLSLTGKLIADLPADFAGTSFIDLRCMETGTSSIKAQWMDNERKNQGALNTVDFTIKKNNPL